MLLINDMKFSTLPEDNRFKIIYEEAHHETLKRFGATVILDFPKDRYKKIPNPNNLGARLETPQGFLQSTYKVFRTPKESFEIRYFESERTTNKGVKKYEPAYIWFKGKMTINAKTQFDKLFYFLFVSPAAQKLDGRLGEYQNMARSNNPQYVVYDEVYEAQKEVLFMRLESEVKALITSPSMGLSENKLIQMAKWYGLIDPLVDYDIDVVRRLLVNYVTTLTTSGYDNTMKKMKDFVDTANLDEVIEVRGLVREAIKLGFIGLLKNGTAREWCILTPNGEKRDFLCFGDWNVGHDSVLVGFLMETPTFRAEISDMVAMKKSEMSTVKELEIDLPDEEGYVVPSYEKKVQRRQKK
jgi:hypothetical protein